MSEFWNKCLDILRQQHAQAVFQTWFADLKADDTGLEDGVLTLIADSSQKSRMTQESYGKAITDRQPGRGTQHRHHLDGRTNAGSDAPRSGYAARSRRQYVRTVGASSQPHV